MHKMMRISAGNGENSSSSSTSLVLNNSDLLIKILLCLPVRSLLVLKPVSKHWCSLISDTYFMQNHYLLHDHSNKLPVSGLYFLCYDQPIPIYGMLLLDKAKLSSAKVSFVIQVNDKPVGLYIEQSCNGLLLCHRPSGYHTGTRYIYNPSTRHYRTIPQPPPFHKENMNMGPCCYWQFYLAFSPNKSLSYEIVFLWRTGDVTHCDHQMAVYSSKRGSWRLCGYVDLDYRLLSHHCVFWNGCLNWINRHTFYYFNISQQLLKKSRLNDEMQKYWLESRENFEECMGHMYLILRDEAPWLTSNCFNVFEMEIDYSGWKPICRVDLGELANHYGKGRVPHLSYSVLKVVVEADGDEDELKALIHLPGYGKFVSYDLKVKSFKEICDSQLGWSVQCQQPAYIGSLANV